MPDFKTIEARREAILEEMKSMRSMRRGTLNEQFLKVPQKGKRQPALRGPYYVFSRREGNKTVSGRLTTPEAVGKARQDIAAYQRFQALAKEFVQLTEVLGEMGRTATDEEVKKKPRSQSNRMQR